MNEKMSLSHFSSFGSFQSEKKVGGQNKQDYVPRKQNKQNAKSWSFEPGQGEKALKTLPIIRKENKRAKTAFPVLAAFSTSSTSKTSNNEHFSGFPTQ